MAKFRKKPVVIEAVRFTLETWRQCEAFCDGRAVAIGNWKHADDVVCLQIETLEGDMTAMPGDWIIKGVRGEFYPCKPDIFEATYDEVSS